MLGLLRNLHALPFQDCSIRDKPVVVVILVYIALVQEIIGLAFARVIKGNNLATNSSKEQHVLIVLWEHAANRMEMNRSE